jgi:hypothetical protein
MYLFHNTADAVLVDDDGGNAGLYVKAPGTWRLIYARNNIWAGTDYAVDNYNTSQPIDLDYDDLWRDGGGNLIRWNNTNYATLPAFTAATGQEAHGLNAASGFADRANGNYTLVPTSGLIDKGVILPGIDDDYVGTAPDIGAFEYQGFGFTLSAMPAVRAVAPGQATTYTLSLQPIGGFTSGVTLTVTSPSPNLSLQLNPASLAVPGQSTLIVTNTYAGPTLTPGVWHTIPVTATGGGVTQTASVGLLVGGTRTYLPLTSRSLNP